MDLSASHFRSDYQVKNTRIHADKSLFAEFLVLQIRKKIPCNRATLFTQISAHSSYGFETLLRRKVNSEKQGKGFMNSTCKLAKITKMQYFPFFQC